MVFSLYYTVFTTRWPTRTSILCNFELGVVMSQNLKWNVE